MKKLFIILFALAQPIVLPAALLTVSYFVRQHEQRQADESLRLLKTAPLAPSAGGDALFLVNYDVADAKVRRQWITQYGTNALQGADEAAFNRLPSAVRAAKLPSIPKDDLACPPRDSDSGCLDAMRHELPAYRERLQQAAKQLANADALSQYPVFDYRINNLSSDALPPFAAVATQHTAAALDWVEHRQAVALSRVCRNLNTGRVLLRSRGGLLDTMVGSAIVARNTALAAEMLAEEPAWAMRFPEDCAFAFAPIVPGEANLCAAMQDEFRFFDEMLQSWMASDAAKMDEKSAFLARLVRVPALHHALFSYEHTRGLHAQNLAQFCTDAGKVAVQQDKPLAVAEPARETKSFTLRPACWGNFVGCVATDAMPSYAAYHDRLLDMLMQQRAFQAALALYELPAAERHEALPQILQQHSSPARQLSYDEKKKQIVFERYDSRENAVAKSVAVRLD